MTKLPALERIAKALDPWLTEEQSQRALARTKAVDAPREVRVVDVDLPPRAVRSAATVEVLQAAEQAVRSGSADAFEWTEWSLRWVETHLFETSDPLVRQALRVVIAAWRATGDLRFRNCLLRAGDILARRGRDPLAAEVLRAREETIRESAPPPATNAAGDVSAIAAVPRGANVVVLSPSIRSRYTAAVVWALQQEGFTVSRVIVRRMFQWKRIRTEWRLSRGKLLVKAIRRGLRIDSPAAVASGESLGEAMRAWGASASLAHLPALACADFTDAHVLAALEHDRPVAIFFTGGGIVRRAVLERSGAGVVNCHMGPLPWYRGMDVIEWPVLYGEPCAVTCHFMNEGIDTGPILLTRPVPLHRGDKFELIRIRAERVMVESMREVARRMAAGTLAARAQSSAEGRQYFTMHPRLVARAAARIDQVAARSQESQQP
ncbi:MAG TPA: formyltransferase family protein [Thermoanaerobaculia bacterium]|jgi:folate-dependent phosphoribosylglycinamide formyltransferase PurN